MAKTEDYRELAESYAKDMFEEFKDEMVEQAQHGEISDDLNNDYSNGDSYHHENNVDKDYDLTEAADLLDQLSDYEESDEGLWQGCEPRKAIAVQAAYTFGNAVYELWQKKVKELNEKIEGIDFGDSDRSDVMGWWLPCYWLVEPLAEESGDIGAAAKTIMEEMMICESKGFGVLADILQDAGRDSEARDLRKAAGVQQCE